MTFSNEEIEKETDFIVVEIGDSYQWSWDDRKNMRFTKFASNRTEPIFKVLRSKFTHQWDYKTIKKAPKILKKQLGDLAKLDKQQIVFTTPASEDVPMLLAVWWPWDHGATVSVRLTVLDGNYEVAEVVESKDGLLTIIKKLFS